MSKPKTVRVRIAVGVTASGDWSAAGYAGAGDDDAVIGLFDCLDEAGSETLVWVEADVPIPEEVTVEGEVRDGRQ